MVGYFMCTDLSHMTSKLVSYTYLMFWGVIIYKLFWENDWLNFSLLMSYLQELMFLFLFFLALHIYAYVYKSKAKLNNYLLREADAKVIFQDASLLNMTGKDYAWIVTEQALEAPNVPTGILGLKLVNATSEESHIKDSV